MARERAIHLEYFEPAKGKVPNPGMGNIGYVYSDHMRFGFTREETSPSVPHEMTPLDRESFDKMVASKHSDNFYYRCEWRDIQKEKGKLAIPKEMEWMIEACHKYGKKWSFRIMSSSVSSVYKDSVPEFIKSDVKMIPYWRVIGVQEWYPKYFPEYSPEFLGYWDELNHMLGEKYDADPALEFGDVSGYGFWGEAHHYCLRSPDQKEEYNWAPDNVVEVNEFLLNSHLDAFPTTPACMNLNYAAYPFGKQAILNNDVWIRRDSFQAHMGTQEYKDIAEMKRGGCMIWETVKGQMQRVKPLLFTPQQFVQHGLDFGANFFAIGFNAWDYNLMAHNYRDILETLDEKLGYRLRPALVWRRENDDKSQDISIQLVNDGCGVVPGVLTLSLAFPDGEVVEKELPAGAPFKGDSTLYELPIPQKYWNADEKTKVRLTAKVRMRGKTQPIRWAVRQELFDPFVVELPLRDFVE